VVAQRVADGVNKATDSRHDADNCAKRVAVGIAFGAPIDQTVDEPVTIAHCADQGADCTSARADNAGAQRLAIGVTIDSKPLGGTVVVAVGLADVRRRVCGASTVQRVYRAVLP